MTVNVIGGEGSEILPYVREQPRYKKNAQLGVKQVRYASKCFIDQTDAQELQVDMELTLMDWGNIFVKAIRKKDSLVKEVDVELNLAGDYKKTKKINWLANEKFTKLESHDFDYLITKRKLEKEDNVDDFINPVTDLQEQLVGDDDLRSVRRGQCI